MDFHFWAVRSKNAIPAKFSSIFSKVSYFRAEFIRELNEPAPSSGSPIFCPAAARPDFGRATEFGRSARWSWFI